MTIIAINIVTIFIVKQNTIWINLLIQTIRPPGDLLTMVNKWSLMLFSFSYFYIFVLYHQLVAPISLLLSPLHVLEWSVC